VKCEECAKLQRKLTQANQYNAENVERITQHYQGRIDALERQVEELHQGQRKSPQG